MELPSGHVLIATASGRFYEFDGATLSVTGSRPTDSGNTEYFLLPLPNGEALAPGSNLGLGWNGQPQSRLGARNYCRTGDCAAGHHVPDFRYAAQRSLAGGGCR